LYSIARCHAHHTHLHCQGPRTYVEMSYNFKLFSPLVGHPNANFDDICNLFNNFQDSIQLEYPLFKGENEIFFDELKLNPMCLFSRFCICIYIASSASCIKKRKFSILICQSMHAYATGYLEEGIASPTSLTGDSILLLLSASDIVSSPGDHGLSARAPTSCM
jgi:hypothetical protein